MDWWRTIAERKIAEAMEEGAFEDLEGRGKPLPLDEEPFEDPSLRMAHRLLRNNGFAPPWVEERKDLEASAEILRGKLRRACASGGDVEEFRREAAELNRRIASHNLKTAAPLLHWPPFDIDAELKSL